MSGPCLSYNLNKSGKYQTEDFKSFLIHVSVFKTTLDTRKTKGKHQFLMFHIHNINQTLTLKSGGWLFVCLTANKGNGHIPIC